MRFNDHPLWLFDLPRFRYLISRIAALVRAALPLLGCKHRVLQWAADVYSLVEDRTLSKKPIRLELRNLVVFVPPPDEAVDSPLLRSGFARVVLEDSRSLPTTVAFRVPKIVLGSMQSMALRRVSMKPQSRWWGTIPWRYAWPGASGGTPSSSIQRRIAEDGIELIEPQQMFAAGGAFFPVLEGVDPTDLGQLQENINSVAPYAVN